MRVAASAALTAAVLSGCTTTVAGHAQAPVEVRYHLDEDTAAGNSPTPRAPLPAAQRWVDVSGTPVRQDATPEHAQYGDRPYPGIYLGQHQADGRTKDCTAGPMVRGTDGQIGFLTAGHCDRTPGGEVYIFADANARQPLSVGNYSNALDDDFQAQDSAVLWSTVPAAPGAVRIGNRFPVAGVMPVGEVQSLSTGTPVCVDAAFSGVRCSPLAEQPAETIKFDEITQGGDSGAAVFVVAQDGRATLIGIHRGVDALNHSVATLLEPALRRLGAELVTAS